MRSVSLPATLRLPGTISHHSPWLRLVTLVTTLVVAGTCCLSSAGCGDGFGAGSGSGKRIELSVLWWGGTERAAITEKVLHLYTAAHPNITFKTQWQANTGYHDKVTELAAGGEAPDIFQVDDNSLTEFAVRSIARDLSDVVGPGKAIDQSRFPESLAGYGNVNGQPFAVANSENTPALFYDKTVLSQLGMPEPQIGWSYDQLITWAETITKKSGQTVYGTMDPSADYKALWLWLRSQGKELYDGSRLGFTARDLERWFGLWADARKRGATPPPEIIAAANTSDTEKYLVVNQKGVTTFAWSNMLSELQKGTSHQLGLTAFPGDPKGQWARASQYWAIYKGSGHAAEAADVINFLVNDFAAGQILGTERGLPANLDVRERIAPLLSEPMQETIRYEREISSRFGPAPAPPPRGHTQVKTLLLQAAERVMWGTATQRQATSAFMTQAQAALGSP
ncbi:MAG: carbohydrate ABC transporter substrate-binding protein [Micromonosporaceae bacterium]|nr:carbohydrate ABC transporter substrate-binding protein [Micromonosporaceae bacterium]